MSDDARLEKWEETKRKFEKTGDKLGKGIDPGIMETVVALNVLGVNTSSSCEGHLNRGIAGPWVDIETENAQEARKKFDDAQEVLKKARQLMKEEGNSERVTQMFEEGHKMTDQARRMNLSMCQKAAGLLNDFYESHSSDFDTKLIMSFFGDGQGRIINQGAEFQPIRKSEEQKMYLDKFTNEMKEFTEFLKRKYFQEDSAQDKALAAA